MSHQCTCGLLGDFKFPLSAQSFCATCFSRKFEKRIIKRIPMSLRGHSVAIALSGGKDSSTLLHILHKYQKKLKIPLLAAIVLEEEIPQIQSSREKIINEIKTKYFSVKFFQKSYTELFNHSLPSLTQQSDKLNLGFTPCAICGVLRRHGILKLAMAIRVDFIVMGNTLEDEATTVLLNIIRGNHQRNFRSRIKYEPTDRESLPLRIKPLSKVFEKTIQVYSNINQVPFLSGNCEFTSRSLRSDISTFLNSMMEKDPHILYNIVSSVNKEQSFKTDTEKVYKCKQCSSYSPDLVCAACRMIRKIMR
ncbi:MAG: ATP-binding protein [Promethearchaeota archaeon]